MLTVMSAVLQPSSSNVGSMRCVGACNHVGQLYISWTVSAVPAFTLVSFMQQELRCLQCLQPR